MISLETLARQINESILGPAEMQETDGIIQVTLNADITGKSAQLTRWANLMEIVDATIGQYGRKDPKLRLHLRGRFRGDGGLCTVTAPFDLVTESRQVEYLRGVIERQDIAELMDGLARIEGNTEIREALRA